MAALLGLALVLDLVPPSRPITILDLMTHTSGMGEATAQESDAAKKLADLIEAGLGEIKDLAGLGHAGIGQAIMQGQAGPGQASSGKASPGTACASPGAGCSWSGSHRRAPAVIPVLRRHRHAPVHPCRTRSTNAAHEPSEDRTCSSSSSFSVRCVMVPLK